MSIAVDISSVVGCVLSAISLGFTVKVFQKIDSFHIKYENNMCE